MKKTKSSYENLKIAYGEIFDTRKQQQEDLDLIYNKFNWIMVSNILLLGYLTNVREHTFISHFAIISLCASLFFCLWSLMLKSSRRGPSLKSMLETTCKGREVFLKALSNKIASDIKKNKKVTRQFSKDLKVAIILLFLGILLMVLNSVL